MTSKDSRHFNWKEDKERQNCLHCAAPFTIVRRRHHCRSCGDIYCSECWGTRVTLPQSYGFTEAQPVCVPCQQMFIRFDELREGCMVLLEADKKPEKLVKQGGVTDFIQKGVKAIKETVRGVNLTRLDLSTWQPMLSTRTCLRLGDADVKCADMEDVFFERDSGNITVQTKTQMYTFQVAERKGEDHVTYFPQKSENLCEGIRTVMEHCKKHGH